MNAQTVRNGAPGASGAAGASGASGTPSRWRLEAAATGGFAGFRSVQVTSEPHYICNNSTSCTPDPTGAVDLTKTTSYTWKPTLSSGLVFRRLFHDISDASQAADTMGLGLGIHVVFLSNSQNEVTAAPAAAFHIGTQHMQVFGGFLIASSDNVVFPNGQDRFTAPVGTATTTFPTTTSWGHPNFFMGIVIGGISVNKAGT
jgi:hypothetical protein